METTHFVANSKWPFEELGTSVSASYVGFRLVRPYKSSSEKQLWDREWKLEYFPINKRSVLEIAEIVVKYKYLNIALQNSTWALVLSTTAQPRHRKAKINLTGPVPIWLYSAGLVTILWFTDQDIIK